MARMPLISARCRPAGPLMLLVAACASLIILYGCASSRSPTSSSHPRPAPPLAQQGEQFGASVSGLFNTRLYTGAQINAQLAALRATGATLARSDALWEATEPSRPIGGVHHYQWGFDDVIAESLAVHGLTWLPIIDYSAWWAQSLPGRDRSAPRPGAGADGYAAYAAAFAARYRRGGTFWRTHPQLPAHPVDTIEIWNEPDSPEFWRPGPDPRGYAELFMNARHSVQAAAPGVRVIVGGLMYPESFLPALLAAEPRLRGALDGIAIHPYGVDAKDVLATVVGTSRTLRALSLDRVPLYVTEFGWTTSPRGALDYGPASRRPQLIEQTLRALGGSGCGIAAVLLHTWVTREHDPADREQWFGISPPGGGRSPDVTAFARGLADAKAATRARPSPACR